MDSQDWPSQVSEFRSTFGRCQGHAHEDPGGQSCPGLHPGNWAKVCPGWYLEYGCLPQKLWDPCTDPVEQKGALQLRQGNEMAMCQREQKRSYLLVFFISKSSLRSFLIQQPVITYIYIYICVSSVLYLIKKGRFRPKRWKALLQEVPLHNFKWHGSIMASPGPRAGHGANGPSVVSYSQQGNENHGMSLMWAMDRCLTGEHTWNHWRGVAGCHHGQRDWWPVLTHDYNDPQGWWQGQHCHTDVRHHVASELALSRARAKPLPKAHCWDQVEWASLTHWRDERGRSQLMGVSESVKSCFWQSLSLACPTKLDWALQHHIVWCSFSSPWH